MLNPHLHGTRLTRGSSLTALKPGNAQGRSSQRLPSAAEWSLDPSARLREEAQPGRHPSLDCCCRKEKYCWPLFWLPLFECDVYFAFKETVDLHTLRDAPYLLTPLRF